MATYDPNAPYDIKKPKRSLLDRLNTPRPFVDPATGIPLNAGPRDPVSGQPINNVGAFGRDLAVNTTKVFSGQLPREAGFGQPAVAPSGPSIGQFGPPVVDDYFQNPPNTPITPDQRAAATGQIPLPEGVRASSVAGIYEGKTGLHGERVFSDNAFDRGLRVRDNRNAAGKLSYDFSRPVEYKGSDVSSQLGLKVGSPEWAKANQTNQMALKPSGQIDYDALGQQVAANKAALAETRVARGEGYDPTGYSKQFAGQQPAIDPKLALDAARLNFDTTKYEGDQQRLDQTRNDEKRTEVFNRQLEKATTNPKIGNMAPEEEALLMAHLEQQARGVTDTESERASREIIQRELGASFKAAGMNDQFVPGQPIDLSNFNIKKNLFGEGITGQPYDENGRLLSDEEAAAREAAGLSVKRGEANMNWLGSDEAGAFRNPTLRSVFENLSKRDKEAKRKKKSEKK